MTRFLAVFVAFVFVALPALAEGADALFDAVESGTPAEVKAALAGGADPNARTTGAATPLHYAVFRAGEPAIIEVLIEAGADANARVDAGKTPLHMAVLSDEPAVVGALLAGGADADARDEDGETPLHVAAWNDRPFAAEALLAAGASHAARDEDGETPLHVAAREANPSVIEALLAGGADPNARNEDGNTPLHLVVYWAGAYDRWLRDGTSGGAAGERNKAFLERTPAVIEALLDGGADAALRDEGGNVPFDYAKDNEALKGTDAYWRLNDGRFE